MKFKRFLVFFLAASMVLPLAGCWDYREFEDLSLVSALGYDYDESTKEITVTLQHYIPAAVGSNNEKGGSVPIPLSGGVVIAKGKSISEALTKIQLARRKDLFYGYLNLILVGEAAAKNIMKEVIAFADRTPNVRSTAYIAVTQGKAEDVLCTSDPNIPVSIGRGIYDLIEHSEKSGYAFPITIQEFSEMLQIEGTEAVTPRVSVVVTKHYENESDTPITGEGIPIRVVNLNEGYHTVDGMAVFIKGKFEGWLEGRENTGLGWITGQKIGAYETISTDSSEEAKNNIIFRVFNSKSKIKVKMDGEKPVFTVSTRVEAGLLKYAESMSYIKLTPDAVDHMQGMLAENVRKEIESALQKCQKELRSDVGGFGFALYRKNPKLWHEKFEKNWADIFPGVQINVEVTAKIQNTGTSILKFLEK